MGRPPPRRQAKRAAGGQTRIALRRYSNMAPSFPLFSPADEDAPYGQVHLDGSLRIALGCGPPLGALHTATPSRDLAPSLFFAPPAGEDGRCRLAAAGLLPFQTSSLPFLYGFGAGAAWMGARGLERYPRQIDAIGVRPLERERSVFDLPRLSTKLGQEVPQVGLALLRQTSRHAEGRRSLDFHKVASLGLEVSDDQRIPACQIPNISG